VSAPHTLRAHTVRHTPKTTTKKVEKIRTPGTLYARSQRAARCRGSLKKAQSGLRLSRAESAPTQHWHSPRKGPDHAHVHVHSVPLPDNINVIDNHPPSSVCAIM